MKEFLQKKWDRVTEWYRVQLMRVRRWWKELLAVLLILAVVPFIVSAASTQSTDLEEDNSEYWSITDANQTGLESAGDFTIEAYVEAEQDPSNCDDSSICSIMTKWYSGFQQYEFHYWDDSGNNEIRLVLHDGNGASTCSRSVDLGINEWHHVAAVYDASAGEVEIYLDGSQVGTTCTGQVNSIQNTDAKVGIGVTNTSEATPIRFWDGNLFDVRYWSEARTASEISSGQDCHVDPTTANLEANWIFNGDGLDETSNNNDLTNNNTATFESNIPASHSGQQDCTSGGPAAAPAGQVITF